MDRKMSDVIYIIHGPNLNLLGNREPGFYGNEGLEEINARIKQTGDVLGFRVECFQFNDESKLVECVQNSTSKAKAIIINPAGFGYTSVALRDVLISSELPVVEVHLSNIHKRESFRHRTLISDICIGQISGFKALSYMLALQAVADYLQSN